MEITVLSKNNSILNKFVSQLRDINVQSDSMRFRTNLERIGEIMAYEISKTFEYSEFEVTTPLGIANINISKEKPVLATILRAGLPLHQGLLNYFDDSENSFISAYRKYSKDGSFHIELEYISCPSVEDKIVILSDPMIATGSSIALSIESLLKHGKPKHIHIVTIICSRDSINYLKKNICAKNITLWTGEIDEELTVKSYIVPGLGDAGDLAFGSKKH